VAASISIAVEDVALDQPYNWEASLYSVIDGRPYAIIGHSVAAGVGDQIAQQATDGRGTVGLAPAGALGATWSTVLPGGTYALLIEAVPEGDPDSRLGDGFLVTFAVPDVGDATDGAETGTSTAGGTSPDDEADDSGSLSDGSNGPSVGGSGADDGSSGGGLSPGTGAVDESGMAVGGTGGNDAEGSYQPPADRTDGTASGGTPDTAAGSGTGNDGSGAGSPTGTTTDGGTSSGSAGNGGDTAEGGPGPGQGSGGSGTGDGGGGPDGGSQPYPGPGADAGSNGAWAVSSILPQTGSVDTENFVQLVGSFPDQPTVWFDDSPADTVFHAPGLIVVVTRRHATAGVVDVSLRQQNEQVLLLPDAFAFLAVDGGQRTSDASTGTGGTGSAGDGGRDGGDDAPGGGTGDPGGPIADGSPGLDGPSGGGDTTVGDADSGLGSEHRGSQPRPVPDGEPVELAGGLSGVPVSGLPISGSTPRCGPGPCQASRV
jgi:hypothetical protein